MMEDLLRWVASTQLGQGAGFLCVLAVPFTVLIVSHLWKGRNDQRRH